MNPTTDTLRLLIELNNHINQDVLDHLSNTDLISLETRLVEWRRQVTAELAWRDHQRREAAQYAARSVA